MAREYNRKLQLSWRELKDTLHKTGQVELLEEIREITLMKPKEIRIYLRRK